MPQKYRRTVVKIGKTSLGVILPKAWLTYFCIKAGDKVEVVSNGHIHIRPIDNHPEPDTTEV